MDKRIGASSAATFLEVLSEQALRTPARLAMLSVRDTNAPGERLTFGQLDLKARAIAGMLQGCMKEGDRALLVYPPGLAFIEAFFGCLYAGVIGIPIYPPRQTRGLPRIRSIVADAETSVALTTDEMTRLVTEKLGGAVEMAGLRWLATDTVPLEYAAEWERPGICGSSIALLQYTSGSTSAPKGVMVSHDNLLENEAMLSRVWGTNAASTVVSWLPHYHDMGLIGNLLHAIYAGATCVLTSPLTFNQRPMLWLELISRFRAQISGGPNFAYDLCVRKTTPEQHSALDLRCWEVAFSGAEPVRYETLARFAEAFEPCGFRWKAFKPGYGLAEATLAVSSCDVEAAPLTLTIDARALEQNRVVISAPGAKGTSTLVGCGAPLTGQEVALVDPITLSSRSEGEIGEIWISSASVARGYWNQPAETERVFQARRVDGGSATYLRTGDLGFISHGQLFITGRMKDLIIVDGRNLYPQDIEQTVDASHRALRPGCGAAFSIEIDGEERLVVVQELDPSARKPDVGEIVAAIRQAVAEQHDVRVYAVRLVRAATIAKTTSGKIQRNACRRAFLDNSLEGVDGE